MLTQGSLSQRESCAQRSLETSLVGLRGEDGLKPPVNA